MSSFVTPRRTPAFSLDLHSPVASGGNLPYCPLYDESSEPGVEFGDSLRAGRHLFKAKCELFDESFPRKALARIAIRAISR